MSRIVPINISDIEIIDGIKNFDEAAGNNLYIKHKDYCMRFMNRMHNDEDSNADIYQDALIVFIEKMRANKLVLENTSIQTYLNSICRNQVLVRINKTNKPVLMGDDWENNFSDKYIDWFDEQSETKNDRITLIMEELEEMKKKGQICYELLKKKFFENKTMQVVASLMNYTNADNAKSQSYKCRERLKKQVFERLQQ